MWWRFGGGCMGGKAWTSGPCMGLVAACEGDRPCRTIARVVQARSRRGECTSLAHRTTALDVQGQVHRHWSGGSLRARCPAVRRLTAANEAGARCRRNAAATAQQLTPVQRGGVEDAAPRHPSGCVAVAAASSSARLAPSSRAEHQTAHSAENWGCWQNTHEGRAARASDQRLEARSTLERMTHAQEAVGCSCDGMAAGR